MSGAGLDWEVAQKIMWSDDDEFEETVIDLNMRSLLDLVTALQGAMAEEQEHFDEVTAQLRLTDDELEHRQISEALCTSQARLARLCARNMRCFTQQAIKARQEHVAAAKSKNEARADPPSPRRTWSPPTTDERREATVLDDDRDYDSEDFVVHRNTFEHDDDETSAAEMVDEGEYEVQEDVETEEQDSSDDDVSDDTVYMADPRGQYVYYVDDKELEVIPEEDEDIEETEVEDQDNELSQAESSDDELTKATEYDSGVMEDHQSSIMEDFEDSERTSLTDSAKGSTGHSPTHIPTRISEEQSDSPDETDLKMNALNIQITESVPQESKDPVIETRLNGHVKLTNGNSQSIEDEETRRQKNLTSMWDPSDLLSTLYRIETPDYKRDDSSGWSGGIPIEGYLEKLPTGKKKSTYWNPWKRRYFRVQDGHLYCYDNSQVEEPKITISLMGAVVEEVDDKIIGVDDRKGHFLAMRCVNEEELMDWRTAIESHCREDFDASYVQPIAYPLKTYRNVIIIDLGSCSTRAGILMDQPSLPQVFFPTVCATHKDSGKRVFGTEALQPLVRKSSNISFPILPTSKITKYTMEIESLPGLFKNVFTELNVNPKDYTLLVCIPRSFSTQTQIAVVRVLLDEFGAKGVNLTHQAILTLYAYKATSGVVVDIGDRMDILPVSEGYIVESGITKLPYGGQRIAHHLRHALAQKQISLFSDVDSYLLRYILEQCCFVARNYEEELERCKTRPESLQKSVAVGHFFQENPPFRKVQLDSGRFLAPEGLFNPKLWGLDSPGIGRLVHRAIQECGMDMRREMARSIYLSGGVTLLPGFSERLEEEIDRLTPPSVTPKVHASPYRYHMAYLGACQLALTEAFENVCVGQAEWMRDGQSCLKKWHL